MRDAEGVLVPNPMRQIIVPPVEQKPNDSLRPAEDAALLEIECNPQEQIVVQLLRWYKLRVGEAMQLAVSDMDLTPGRECLTVRENKTAAGRRAIPIVPELLPHLQDW